MPKTMTELLALFPNNPTILDAAIKTEDHINRQAQQGGKIMVSISGGSDSDIMLDMFERIGYPYEYTRRYRRFKESLKRERRRRGQIELFDDPYEIVKEEYNG